MKLASRKPVTESQQRRNNLLAERTRAPVMRDAHPDVGQLQVALVFKDDSIRTPSPQSYTFYPAARAFFRFTCPCNECDGDFDLGDSVRQLVKSLPSGKRAATRMAKGSLQCEGVRLRDRTGSRNCSMTLEYRLEVVAPE
jgi:hypothetical protein